MEQEEMDEGDVGDGQGTIMGNPDGHDDDRQLIGFEGGENTLNSRLNEMWLREIPKWVSRR